MAICFSAMASETTTWAVPRVTPPLPSLARQVIVAWVGAFAEKLAVPSAVGERAPLSDVNSRLTASPSGSLAEQVTTASCPGNSSAGDAAIASMTGGALCTSETCTDRFALTDLRPPHMNVALSETETEIV